MLVLGRVIPLQLFHSHFYLDPYDQTQKTGSGCTGVHGDKSEESQNIQKRAKYSKLGGGFKYFLCSSLFGEESHFDLNFSNGLVQPPTRKRGAFL